jgi:hypothetical protein
VPGAHRFGKQTTALIGEPDLRAWSQRNRAARLRIGYVRLMEVCYDLPDFRRRMLAAERRSGNQIFAHRQSPDDDGVENQSLG